MVGELLGGRPELISVAGEVLRDVQRVGKTDTKPRSEVLLSICWRNFAAACFSKEKRGCTDPLVSMRRPSRNGSLDCGMNCRTRSGGLLSSRTLMSPKLEVGDGVSAAGDAEEYRDLIDDRANRKLRARVGTGVYRRNRALRDRASATSRRHRMVATLGAVSLPRSANWSLSLSELARLGGALRGRSASCVFPALAPNCLFRSRISRLLRAVAARGLAGSSCRKSANSDWATGSLSALRLRQPPRNVRCPCPDA